MNNTTGNGTIVDYTELKNLFQNLIPAFIFTVLLIVCVVAMACRNVVRYCTGYEPPHELLPDEGDKDEEAAAQQNNISSYKLSEGLDGCHGDDTISPQNAKQLEQVDNKMTDVMYT